MSYYDKVHLWIGTVNKTENEYLEYFKLDYSGLDIDDPDYKVCGFCKDIGKRWYDEDFLGNIPLWEKDVELDEILVEAAVSEVDKEKVIAKCNELGIKKANAVLWYSESDLKIPDPNKSFNGLRYIGEFERD